MKRTLIFLLIITIFSVSCSPGASSRSPAVTISLDVALTPALQPLADALRFCTARQSAVLLVVHEYPIPAIFDAAADLYITLGEPDPLPDFIAQVAWERVVLIAHSSADVSSLNLPFIRTLFTALPSVDNPASAQIWVPLTGDETLQAFQATVLGPARLTTDAYLAPNPSAMLAAVSADPSALGILPAAWLDESMRSVDLDIRLPVLLTAPQTPSGPALELTACLQSAAGQAVLAERYQPMYPSTVATPEP